MRLICNMGNQDIRVTETDGKDYILKQSEFVSRLYRVVSILPQAVDSMTSDGQFIKPFDIDEAHSIKAVEFPILKAAISSVEKETVCKIDKLTICVSNQSSATDAVLREKDTLGYWMILSSNYGKKVFPGIEFSSFVISANPADYGEMYRLYSDWFSSQKDQDYSIVIGSGTPAMCCALASCSVYANPAVQQFYSGNNGRNETTVTRLRLFPYKQL